MRKYLLCLLGMATLLLPSCSDEFDRTPEDASLPDAASTSSPKGLGTLRTEGARAGVVHIRIKKDVLRSLRLPSEGMSLRSAPSQLSQVFSKIGATKLEPMFAIDPRFEKRMRKAGLDQWYVVRFSELQDLRNVIGELQAVPEVEVAELSYVAKLPDVTPIPLTDALRSSAVPMSNDLPFDDPRLVDQWHYRNAGITSKHTVGADINLFEAWQITTGTPNVIVAVVDGGIDTTHPDLIDNLHVNELERDGVKGKDDDGNGFVDDIYGFNFITNRGDLYPDAVSHGTHVAGTVAARNNNGIGVAGVAGGNHLIPGTGIKMISCQTFGRRQGQGMESGNSAAAIVYGANNGAVISQNSWGYEYPGVPEIPKSMKDAIDYFIEHAGCDADGNQLEGSPMKGGVVIFAAGNDGKDYLSFPGAYGPTIAVSAMGPNDWQMAPYSNRGAWVDIMAPGGDATITRGQVLSTLAPASTGSQYGYMQGTSMACPHVSGVAALIVSHYGGPGFTNKELETRLVGSFRPKNIDVMNPRYVGRLGRGYIDAGKVFAEDGKIAPEKVSDLSMEGISFLTASMTWSSVEDRDDTFPTEYRIYLSETAITSVNYLDAYHDKVNGISYEPGIKLSYAFKGLKENTTYYVGIESVDRWGNVSELTLSEFKTLKNTAPTLTSSQQSAIRVFAPNKVSFTIEGSDVDGQDLRFEVTGDTKGVSYVRKGNTLAFSISAVAPVGKYSFTVKVFDELGASASLEVPFEVYQYKAPEFASNVGSQVVGLKGQHQVDLAALITNTTGNALSYSLTTSDASVLTASVSEAGVVSLQGLKVGVARVSVEVTDGITTLTTSFSVRVAENASDAIYSVYPVPAKTSINVSLNPKVTKATIEIVSLMGTRVFQQDYTPAGADALRIGVARLTPGVYTLRATTNLGVYTKTFTKI